MKYARFGTSSMHIPTLKKELQAFSQKKIFHHCGDKDFNRKSQRRDFTSVANLAMATKISPW